MTSCRAHPSSSNLNTASLCMWCRPEVEASNSGYERPFSRCIACYIYGTQEKMTGTLQNMNAPFPYVCSYISLHVHPQPTCGVSAPGKGASPEGRLPSSTQHCGVVASLRPYFMSITGPPEVLRRRNRAIRKRPTLFAAAYRVIWGYHSPFSHTQERSASPTLPYPINPASSHPAFWQPPLGQRRALCPMAYIRIVHATGTLSCQRAGGRFLRAHRQCL